MKTSGIDIKDNNIAISSTGNISIAAGGKFTINSGNFAINADGSVSMTGKITAGSGKIGGWTISTDRLYAGSGTSYVALNTNASYPAIWAGNSTYSSAPFRVYRDGSVYITQLNVLNEDQTATTMNLRSDLWKLNRAVKTLSVENGVLTIALYNGTSVNFNKADLSKVSVGTSGGGSVYPIDASGKSVGIGKTVYIPINGVNSLTYNADTKKIGATCDIYLGDGVRIKQETIGVDATSAYDAGMDYANSLYSTVNVTPISTAHRVTYVSITRQGTGKSPTPKVLYNSAGQAVTVYDVGSASTVYTKGSTVEYYTVAYDGTVLYEAGTQKTYYTKSE